MGYINAALEIIEQCKELNLDFDYVVSATSSGGTQTGIMLGYKMLVPSTKILNIGVTDPREELLSDVYNLIEETLDMLDIQKIIPQDSKVLFVHIGGIGGLFQYEDVISKMLNF